MTDDEWEVVRRRAILAAFETGRPVFADSDGVLRHADGAQETIDDEVGAAFPAAPRPLSWWGRLKRWLRGRS